MTKEVRVQQVKKGDIVSVPLFVLGKRFRVVGKVKRINKTSDVGGMDNDRIIRGLELVLDTTKHKENKRVPGVAREFVFSTDPKEFVEIVEGMLDMDIDEKKLRKIAGMPEKLVEAKNPKTKIGKHSIEILTGGRSKMPFGGNKVAIIKFDGKQFEVFKQGMINIWAFAKRPILSRSEGDEFDDWMDDNIGKVK